MADHVTMSSEIRQSSRDVFQTSVFRDRSSQIKNRFFFFSERKIRSRLRLGGSRNEYRVWDTWWRRHHCLPGAPWSALFQRASLFYQRRRTLFQNSFLDHYLRRIPSLMFSESSCELLHLFRFRKIGTSTARTRGLRHERPYLLKTSDTYRRRDQ